MIKTRYLIVVAFLLGSNLLLAQAPAWGGGADQTDLSFGFNFGYVSSYYKIVKKPDWRTPFFDPGVNKNITDSLSSIGSKPLPGFAIGFVTRYRVFENLEVRITPSLIFADRSLTYTYPTASEDVTKQVQPTIVDFPLSLKLRSDRVGNFRAYILGGLKYSQSIGKGAQDDTTDPLEKKIKNVSGYSSYEAGLGCDIYFEFFKLSPEIKISNSLGNVLVPEYQPFSTPISKLSLHTIVFSLYFE